MQNLNNPMLFISLVNNNNNNNNNKEIICDPTANMDIDGDGLFTVNPFVVLPHLVLRPPCLMITILLEYDDSSKCITIEPTDDTGIIWRWSVLLTLSFETHTTATSSSVDTRLKQ